MRSEVESASNRTDSKDLDRQRDVQLDELGQFDQRHVRIVGFANDLEHGDRR
jgi:hypothetical protein